MTGGGLQSNFEVNTIFNEKKPIYYSQLQAIYNSIKFIDSLFTPDEDYINGYSDIFKAFEKNEEKALKDKGIAKTIKEIEQKELILPGTIPSIISMIIDFIKNKNGLGINSVTISEIYEELEKRIIAEKLTNKYKLDTFRNSMRGELNHNELNSNSKNSLHLFERVGRGEYQLTENGKNFKGR